MFNINNPFRSAKDTHVHEAHSSESALEHEFDDIVARITESEGDESKYMTNTEARDLLRAHDEGYGAFVLSEMEAGRFTPDEATRALLAEEEETKH